MPYSTEKNHQILIGLLKYHGIKKIIVSPGANNVSFVASVQNDNFFEIYSCVDERSASYIACGLAAESGEPVVLSCTGATASRNYLSGLTEAYYRHLPVLAITSTMPICRIGHNYPQCIDRTNVINDVAKLSVYVPFVKDSEDEWTCNVRINQALLELNHCCPGPVHINIETKQSGTFGAEVLEGICPIDRLSLTDKFPELDGRVAVFVGSHKKWDDKLTDAVDEFCEKYNAVVWHDHTSNYKGKYGCLGGLVSAQTLSVSPNIDIDHLIYFGDISGAYLNIKPKKVWRISPDGEFVDYFKKLRYVFEMKELDFFQKMNEKCSNKTETSYFNSCKEEYLNIVAHIDGLPFSNIFVAKEMSDKLPENAVIHFGILNSLRSWNFFEIDKSIYGYSNVGGFGIDGCVSSLLGGALAAPDRIHFGIVGDLAFFYDMNVLGNRHFANNIRLLVVNNGCGQEFKNYRHRAAQFGIDTNQYIAAAGHYGSKSHMLIKDYAKNLGFKYLGVSNKAELKKALEVFCSAENTDKPLILEVFTDTEDETDALKRISTLEVNGALSAKEKVKSLLGEDNLRKLKKVLKR